MQTLIAPIGHDVGWDLNIAQHGGFRPPVIVKQWMLLRRLDEFLRPREGKACRPLCPGHHFCFRNAAVKRTLAIAVAPTFPRIDRCEMRRIERADTPLHDGEV